MDTLDDVLDTLDLKGAFYFRTNFSPPWAVEVPELQQAARFHLVVEGRLHIRFPSSGEQTVLGPGDLIVIPRGRSHILSDEAGKTAPSLETVLADAGYTGDGVLAVGDGEPHAKTKLICGHFSFRPEADHPILNALPDFQVMTASMRAENATLDEVIRMLVRQVFSGSKVGSAASVTRLSEVMFIELLRIGIENNKHLETVLSAFSDSQISQSLSLMHSRPEHLWTVESLAREIGMSRSRFANRFQSLLKMGPMSYLADWRLQKSLFLLHNSKKSVQEISSDSGYQSPAAFTRAFSDKFGIAPTKYRKSA
ncbi:AraC family transcriptional regulator [Sneathiella marina]|uniref:AraC family transcriptional regulator n=1 Tax=Sneathiella marina TaxID=2950108 RepID=A0ABY4W6B2_9PROT|nr:AraC family transcriptional regulator [Sneathiella marina]USG62557.1 AraC family transcriptional regulator [Sneathiella marina]